MICYVCGGRCRKDVVHGPYIYWKCQDCFTSQVLPQPTQEDLQKFYDKFHLGSSLNGVYDEVEDRMQADFPAKVKKVRSYSNPKLLSLLDVGCGKGFFIKEASNNNMVARGIDYSITGVDFAVNTLNVNAIAGRIEDKQNEWSEVFDVVTLWATIEHLSDPASVLVAIRNCLKPNGLLFLDTGLGNIYWENFLIGHSQWYDAPQHLFVFSEEGLVNLLQKCGFNIIHIDRNYERSSFRKSIRWLRHTFLCTVPWIFLNPIIGIKGVSKMREEAKWPIGRLVSLVVQKKNEPS